MKAKNNHITYVLLALLVLTVVIAACQQGTFVPAGQVTEAFTAQSSSTACSNGIWDGTESDVDCGGTACTKCAAGKVCYAHSDCASNSCTGKCG